MVLSLVEAKIAAIVLAAGQGTRMKSSVPKVLHACCDRPMLVWILKALESVGVEQQVVVIGHGADQVREVLGESVQYAVQSERLGTAHAAQMALPLLENFSGSVLIVAGDTPLLRGETLKKLVDLQHETSAPCVMATCLIDDPTGYGRIVRDEAGQVIAIVEHKDCTPEQLNICEMNPAVYCFDSDALRRLLPLVKNDNSQGEYYLPDLIKHLVAEGSEIETVVSDDPDEFRGVNDRWQLSEAAGILQTRVLRELSASGVTIVDPQSTFISPEVQIGMESVIQPNCVITGKTVIGQDCNIGPGNMIRSSVIGDNCNVFMSHMNEAVIGNGVKVGPFSNIRPGSVLGDKVKVGNFVETKKSDIGAGSSISHLTYMGDATIGQNTNVGAGTITCNYDGFSKHQTQIGDDCFIGSNSTLIAPVAIGNEVMIAAGSVVTEDVPDGAMAIGRGKQVTKDGWFQAWRKTKTNKSDKI